MRSAAFLVCILVLGSPALAGCLGPDEPATLQQGQATAENRGLGVEVATDARGDARIYTLEDTTGDARPERCDVVPAPARPACIDLISDVTGASRPFFAAGDGIGVYEPALDVLSASFEETPDALVVSITVASLDASFSPATDGEEVSLGWRACWRGPGEADADWAGWERTECVYFEVGGGESRIDPVFERGKGCNHWDWCAWAIPHEVEFGTPATLRLTIPRAIMGTAEAGDVLEGIRVGSFWTRWPVTGRPSEVEFRAGAPGIYSDQLTSWMGYGVGWGHLADESPRPGGVFAFQTPRVSSPELPVDYRFHDDTGDTQRMDLDILYLQVIEAPSTITMAMQLARVDAQPDDHSFWLAMGMPSGRVHEAWYKMRDGRLESGAGVCNDQNCSRWVEYPVTFQRDAGAPGWINLTASRFDLDSPMRGELVNLLFGGIWAAAGQASVPPFPGPAAASASLYAGDADAAGNAAPYWFWMDTA